MSDPKPGRQPADRKTAQDDVEGATTATINHGGKEYTVDVYADPDDMPGDLWLAVESDQFSRLLPAILGEKQWLALQRTKPTRGDYKAVARAWVKACGLGDDAGE